MSTSWSETAGEICRDALEHLTAIGADDPIEAVDFNKALRALNSVLKALPLHGYTWPKLSTSTALVWSGLTPQTIDLPLDFYNYPVVHFTHNNKKVQLGQIPHSHWVAMTDQDKVAEHPTSFYISPDKKIYFYPVPTQDPVATLQYQRIVDDVSAATVPDMLQIWINPLGWGVADELSMDYGINAQDRIELNKRWINKRDKALEGSISFEPIVVTVDDCYGGHYGPLNR